MNIYTWIKTDADKNSGGGISSHSKKHRACLVFQNGVGDFRREAGTLSMVVSNKDSSHGIIKK